MNIEHSSFIHVLKLLNTGNCYAQNDSRGSLTPVIQDYRSEMIRNIKCDHRKHINKLLITYSIIVI